MDEITLTGTTLVAAISGNNVEVQTTEPEQFGFGRCRLEDLQGGDAEQNEDCERSSFPDSPVRKPILSC